VDLQKGIVNYQTPIAQQLMGHIVGDVLPLTLDGQEGQYVVEKIEAGIA